MVQCPRLPLASVFPRLEYLQFSYSLPSALLTLTGHPHRPGGPHLPKDKPDKLTICYIIPYALCVEETKMGTSLSFFKRVHMKKKCKL